MANIKDLVKSIGSTLKTNVSSTGIGSNDNIVNVTISSESMDEGTAVSAKAGVNNLLDSVDNTISAILSSEEFAGVDFKEHQIQAAKKIAALAVNPKLAGQALSNPRSVDAPKDAVIVSAEDLGIDDITTELSTETYDGESINNALYYSVAFNILASRQDKFAETWFPTIVIDPLISGLSIDIEYTSLFTEFERDIKGTPAKDKFNKTPIIKAMYDPAVISKNKKNKAIPVLREGENDENFLTELKHQNDETGVVIETAPLLFGTNRDILGLSQTDELIAKGIMDHTDTLDRTVNLSKVYYSLTGKDDDNNDVKELFVFDTSVFPHSNFTYSTQAHSKDLTLTFSTGSAVVNTTNTKTAKNAVSANLSKLAPDYSINVELVIHGDGNATYGDVVVYGTSIKMLQVRDAAGNLVPEDSDEYGAIKDLFDTIKFEGYDLEAYRTNSNLRTRGRTITTDKYTQIYQVPMRTGYTAMSPVSGFGGDTDAKLAAQIQMIGIDMSMEAVQTLIKHAERLYNATVNGAVVIEETVGISRHFVNTYYSETDMALDEFVDSKSSKDRLNDIKSAFEIHLRDEVYKMWTNSNYFAAFEILYKATGLKPTVIIGVNPRIYQYLSHNGGIDLGDEFNVELVSTPNPLIGDKIYMSFGIFDETRNSKPNALNFGQTVWASTITTDIPRTIGGSTSREVTNTPRYLHIPNLNVMSVTNVTGIDKVLRKVVEFRREA